MVPPTAPSEVLLVGDPRLRERARPVGDPRCPAFREERERLHRTLSAFRERHGFGRAIAAPQIAVPLRFVAVDLGEETTWIDPEIVERSRETFTLWDDCMSFPDLLVRVERHVSVTMRYTDEAGNTVERPASGRAEAELIQHELDHLDGVLALDRALDRTSIVHRRVFHAREDTFRAQVDGL